MAVSSQGPRASLVRGRALKRRYGDVSAGATEGGRFLRSDRGSVRARHATFQPERRANTLGETLRLIVALLRDVLSASPFRNCRTTLHVPGDARTFEQFLDFVERRGALAPQDVESLLDNLTGLGARLGDAAYVAQICGNTLRTTRDIPALRQLKEILAGMQGASNGLEASIAGRSSRFFALLSGRVGQRLAECEREQCEQLAGKCRAPAAKALEKVAVRLMQTLKEADGSEGGADDGASPVSAWIGNAIQVLTVEEQQKAIAALDRIHEGRQAVPDVERRIREALAASLRSHAQATGQELLDIQRETLPHAISSLLVALDGDDAGQSGTVRDIRPCQDALSRLDAAVSRYNFLASRLARVRETLGRRPNIPKIRIDEGVVDRAIQALLRASGFTGGFPAREEMEASSSMTIAALRSEQILILEKIPNLWPHSALLNIDLTAIASARLALHEEEGARRIVHILENRLAPHLEDARAAPALCASVLRDVLDEVMYVDDVRRTLFAIDDIRASVATPEELGPLRSAFLGAGRQSAGVLAPVFEPLWREWSHVVKALYEDMVRAHPPGSVATGRTLATALRTLGDLSGLLGTPAADAVCTLSEDEMREWRAALAARVGVALDESGRILAGEMPRLHAAAQASFTKESVRGLAYRNWSVPDSVSDSADWEVIGADGGGATDIREFASHRVTNQFLSDVVDRGGNCTFSINSHRPGQYRVAYAEDIAPTQEPLDRALRVDAFLAELDKAGPGCMDRVMRFLHQGQVAFYQDAMIAAERAFPLGNPAQYAFRLDRMPNNDIRLKVVARFDQVAILQKISNGVLLMASAAPGGTAEYSSVLVIPADEAQPVRQLGLMAFEMTAKPAGRFDPNPPGWLLDR